MVVLKKETGMLYQALQKAKKGDDKKVAVNIQVPSALKDAFEELCKSEGVSMTALMCALMETAIEEQTKNSFYKNDTLQLVEELEKIMDYIKSVEDAKENGAEPMDAGLGNISWDTVLEAKYAAINAIKTELENRGRRVL